MRRLMNCMIVLGLLLAMVPMGVDAHTVNDPFTTELIAGQHYDVGEIQVWNDGEKLYVKYLIDADLTPDDLSDDGVPTLIYETHLHVATSLGDIPQNNQGLPKIGQFSYSGMHDPGVMEVLYEIPLAGFGWEPGQELYIAAHAVVQKLGGLSGLELALPDTAQMKVQYPVSGGTAYFPTVEITGLTGSEPFVTQGWCVDTDHTISQNVKYTADVYSSYENLPEGTVEYPENMDLVNWIINQGYVGQTSPGCGGSYTYGDIQRAIWALVEDAQSTSGLGAWSQCRVDEILAAAQANGEGFVPSCDQKVAVVLIPRATNQPQVIIAQVTLAELSVPCETIEETAWGQGAYFNESKSWAMYFTYTVQSSGPTVTPGEPSDKLKGFGVRYRSFGNTGADEIYLGRGDLGVQTNREQLNFGSEPWGANNGIRFEFDEPNDRLLTGVDVDKDGVEDFALTYDNLTSQVAALNNGCTVDEVDFMILSVVGRDAGTTVDFNNVTLNGISLGNFSGTGGWFNWTVTGFDFSEGFTVRGDLLLDGSFGTSQELSKLEIQLACEGTAAAEPVDEEVVSNDIPLVLEPSNIVYLPTIVRQ